MNEQVRVRTYFTYPVPAVSLAAGASATSVVRIESATNFYWIKSTYHADDDAAVGNQEAATRIIPSVDVQIQTSGADRNLFNAFVPIPSVFGTGEIPFVLPMPMLLQANSELRVDFLSREATRTLNIALSLVGWKDYGTLDAA